MDLISAKLSQLKHNKHINDSKLKCKEIWYKNDWMRCMYVCIDVHRHKRTGVFISIHTYYIKTQSSCKRQQAKTEYQLRTDLNCDSVNVVY